MRRKLAISILFLLTTFAHGVNAGELACRAAFHPRLRHQPAPIDLEFYRDSEIYNLSRSEIKALNKQTVLDVQAFVPDNTGPHASQVSYRDLETIIAVMRNHPIVAPSKSREYSQPGIDTGFCFGRSGFSHFLLRKMHLQQNSILKIWAVGTMRVSPYETAEWGFHVTTLAYTPEGWMAVDPFTYKPEPVAVWVAKFQKQSTDGRVRFYVTDPKKFSVGIGDYDRLQMGLDLPEFEDWYRSYFPKMMTSIRETPLSEYGLRVLSKSDPVERVPQDEFSPWNFWKSIWGL